MSNEQLLERVEQCRLALEGEDTGGPFSPEDTAGENLSSLFSCLRSWFSAPSNGGHTAIANALGEIDNFLSEIN